MSFLCRIGWHKSKSDPDRGEWSVRCTRCGRKGEWNLISGHTTWEPKPSYLWGFLKWFWNPQKHPHPDPAFQAELEGEQREHRELYERWRAHQRKALGHRDKAKEHRARAQEHEVKALVHKVSRLAHNEYARALALAHRRRGQNVPVPPSLVGRIHDDQED